MGTRPGSEAAESRQRQAGFARSAGSEAHGDGTDKKVYRTIVEVRVNHGLGGGVVVDAAKGLVATNFHVVSGATKGVVVFSSDKDRKEYAIDGFVAALPGRDLAILHVQAGDKKLTALELAQKLPEQGETVYVFGSSVGLSGTVARGMVAAIRSSQDLADLWDRKEGKGFFKRVLGYDMGCTWIQHDAAGLARQQRRTASQRAGQGLGA